MLFNLEGESLLTIESCEIRAEEAVLPDFFRTSVPEGPEKGPRKFEEDEGDGESLL